MSDVSIKKINVKIKDVAQTQEFDLGSKAQHVIFSDSAVEPFKEQPVEDSVSNALNNAANIIIYAKPYIRNNDPDRIVDYINQQHGSDAIKTSISGYKGIPSGGFSISYGQGSVASGYNSQAFGFDCVANGWASHAEGYQTKAGSLITQAENFSANYAHAEGGCSAAINDMAHAEGDATNASGHTSHTEGSGTKVFGLCSHAEGQGNTVGDDMKIVRDQSKAIYNTEKLDIQLEKDEETFRSYINGQFSHAEGLNNTIFGAASHAEGVNNRIDAVYAASAMGEDNIVQGNRSVVMGKSNIVPSGTTDALFMGRYSSKGIEQDRDINYSPSLVIGAGTSSDTSQQSNLMEVRYPATGMASNENLGILRARYLACDLGPIMPRTETRLNIRPSNPGTAGIHWELVHKTIWSGASGNEAIEQFYIKAYHPGTAWKYDGSRSQYDLEKVVMRFGFPKADTNGVNRGIIETISTNHIFLDRVTGDMSAIFTIDSGVESIGDSLLESWLKNGAPATSTAHLIAPVDICIYYYDTARRETIEQFMGYNSQ